MASPTIQDVAEKAGVSIATVSRVYNSPNSVKEATRDKVLRAAEALNYAPKLAARALTLQKTDIIGVILPGLGGEFFSELIRSIDQVAYQHGFHIMLSTSHSHRNEVDLLLRLMGQGWVDGLILMVPVLGRLSMPPLPRIDLPIVLLNLPETNGQYIHINVDNYRGAYLITKHLLDHGYNPIAMIRGPDGNHDAETREKGFGAAMTERGLNPEGGDNRYLERGDFTRRSGYLAMLRLLSLPVPPRAVFAANDEMAIGAFFAARQHGLRIPEQIAIAGFDDIDVASCISPTLTTVHVPITELGMMAAQKLIEVIKSTKENGAMPQKILLSTGLVIRESCGCSPTGAALQA
jgi:LacI family transcriptional regulator